MTKAPSQRSGYFDTLYAKNPDPWCFETSVYEQSKYEATIAALGGRRFGSALEAGCSIGVLTRQLAAYCDNLLAIDIARTALIAAETRCADLPNVRFALSTLPETAPPGPFDLIVLSEVLYYFDRDQLTRLAAQLQTQMSRSCTLLLVHWLGPTPDYPLNGDAATTAFTAALTDFQVIMQDRQPEYRLDLLHVPSH